MRVVETVSEIIPFELYSDLKFKPYIQSVLNKKYINPIKKSLTLHVNDHSQIIAVILLEHEVNDSKFESASVIRNLINYEFE